jgi:MFS family permease
VILATSALTALGAVLTIALVHEGPFPFPRATFNPRQTAEAWRNRGLRLASFGYFGHMWELYAMWAWFLAFFTAALAEDGRTGTSIAALGTFAVIGVGFVGCYAGGVLGDRWGRTKTTSLAMAVSGACALLAGFVFTASPWVVFALGLVWGVAVVADSAQFSTMVSELADQAYVGTALTLQLAIGFTLTVVTIWLIPIMRDEFGWEWAFALLVPGPVLGIAAMLYLRRLPEANLIAGGRG